MDLPNAASSFARKPSSPKGLAVRSCLRSASEIMGHNTYWMNFDTENSEKKASAIKALLDRLIMRAHSWSVVSFVLTDSSIRSRDRKCQMGLLPEFLDQIKLLASQQLMSFQSNHKANGDAHDVLHNRFRDPVASAISIFSRYGEAEDKEILMRLIDDPDYGEEIVRALRNIRERGAGPST